LTSASTRTPCNIELVRRTLSVLALFALLAAALPAVPWAAPATRELPPPGIPVARAALVQGTVQRTLAAGRWQDVKENERLLTGDRVRTGPGASVRFDFPWTSITLSGQSEFAIAASRVLSTLLESGRAEVVSDQAGMIKLVTPEARVVGSGHVAVRRDGSGTWVMGFQGSQTVQARGMTVRISEGEGTRVPAGQAPQAPRPLPAPPLALAPAEDPVYVTKGTPASLQWEGAAPAYRVEVLGLDGRDVVLSREVKASPASVDVPWLGTFRWRVRAVDVSGFEGIPSETRLLCIVEK
jgi:hypothetical protein